MRFCDLHAHTTESDGTLSPTRLVELAAREGLAALAVTDHDTLGALPEARAAGARLGVEVVPGVELSVAHPLAGDVHLLGYFVRETPRFGARLAGLRDARARRGERIVEKLRALGVDVAMEDVEKAPAVGRPHVARALMRKGVVASVQEAFDRYLAEGRPAFVPKEKLDAAEAIGLVHEAGGVAVLAHAGILPERARGPLVRELAALGLDGLEVLHPKNGPEVRERLKGWCGELRLVETGGSDFHGESKPDVRLGMERVSLAALDALRERATGRGRARGSLP
jgi:predicted metal-dependent phosphoesterase TrpH